MTSMAGMESLMTQGLEGHGEGSDRALTMLQNLVFILKNSELLILIEGHFDLCSHNKYCVRREKT